MIQDSMSTGSCLVLADVGVRGNVLHDSRELHAVGTLIPPHATRLPMTNRI